MPRWLVLSLTAVAAVVVGVQLVPYGRDHGAGPAPAVGWPSPEVASSFTAACADCHTERTHWPWYSNVAPVSWMVQWDVDRGREEWNLSDEVDDFGDAADELREGSMPPSRYTIAHPGARLSDREKAALIAAFEALDERS